MSSYLGETTSFKAESFRWLNDPTIADLEGRGTFSITEDGSELVFIAPPKRDFWSRTFYDPILIKNDASALLYGIAMDVDATICVDFTLTPKSQFDQAGLLAYLDDIHWIKCGIEYYDGAARLSVVVCNNYSDWSTQPWPTLKLQDGVISTGARLRVHKLCHSESVVVEAAALDAPVEGFQMVRIAHCSLRSTHTDIDSTTGAAASTCGADSGDAMQWRIGPYAACPTEQAGCTAKFTNLKIGPFEKTVHGSAL